MNAKESDKFQRMYISLRRIAKGYLTPAQIRRDSAKGVLEFEEYIEMAYENIQQEAKNGLRGVRLPKGIQYLTPSSGPPIGTNKGGMK